MKYVEDGLDQLLKSSRIRPRQIKDIEDIENLVEHTPAPEEAQTSTPPVQDVLIPDPEEVQTPTPPEQDVPIPDPEDVQTSTPHVQNVLISASEDVQTPTPPVQDVLIPDPEDVQTSTPLVQDVLIPDLEEVQTPTPHVQNVLIPDTEEVQTPTPPVQDVLIPDPEDVQTSTPTVQDVLIPDPEDVQTPTHPVQDVLMPDPEEVQTPTPPVQDVLIPDPEDVQTPTPPVQDVLIPDPEDVQTPTPPVQDVLIPDPEDVQTSTPPVEDVLIPDPEEVQTPTTPVQDVPTPVIVQDASISSVEQSSGTRLVINPSTSGIVLTKRQRQINIANQPDNMPSKKKHKKEVNKKKVFKTTCKKGKKRNICMYTPGSIKDVVPATSSASVVEQIIEEPTDEDGGGTNDVTSDDAENLTEDKEVYLLHKGYKIFKAKYQPGTGIAHGHTIDRNKGRFLITKVFLPNVKHYEKYNEDVMTESTWILWQLNSIETKNSGSIKKAVQRNVVLNKDRRTNHPSNLGLPSECRNMFGEDHPDKQRGLKRTRKYNEQAEEAKRRAGLAYQSRKGQMKQKKKMKPPCTNCRSKCYEKVTDEDRIKAFSYYRGVPTKGEQRHMLLMWSKCLPIKRSRIRNKNIDVHTQTETLDSDGLADGAPQVDVDNVAGETDLKGSNKRKQKERKFSYNYFLPVLNKDQGGTDLVPVCKKMFMNTLDITDIVFLLAHKKDREGIMGVELHEEVTEEDEGACANKRLTVLEDNKFRRPKNKQMRCLIENHIELFPVIDSHYCRRRSKRQYLATDLSITKMYELFCEWSKDEHPGLKIPGIGLYREVFNNTYNIGFFQPKKDQCDSCDSWKHHPETTSKDRIAYKAVRQGVFEDRNFAIVTDTLSDVMKEQVKHATNIELARHEFKNDTLYAKEKSQIECAPNAEIPNQETAVSIATTPYTIPPVPLYNIIDVASFDLQQILQVPCTQVSSMYYLSKYNVYNLVIKSMFRKGGDCYMWGQDSGRKGANQIATSLMMYIEKQTKEYGTKEFFFYSDNCPGQNLNRVIPLCFIYCAIKFDVTITHKFLEVGHTQMSCDSIHSLIERKKKGIRIYIPAQWQTVAELCGNYVHFFDFSEFLNFRALIDTFPNWHNAGDVSNIIPVNWKCHKAVKVSPEDPFVLKMKVGAHSEEFVELNLLHNPAAKRTQPKQIDTMTFMAAVKQENSAPLKLPKTKFDKLLDCCQTNIIPKQYHHFYYSLGKHVHEHLDSEEIPQKNTSEKAAEDATEEEGHGERASRAGEQASRGGQRGSRRGQRGSRRGQRGTRGGQRGNRAGERG